MSHFGNVRIGWRQLAADPVYALVVIAGLAVAIAAAVLTLAFVKDKLLADAGVPDSARVVAFEWQVRGPGGSHSEWMATAPLPLGPALREAGAPVVQLAQAIELQMSLRAGPRSARLQTLASESGIGAVFGLRPLAGNLGAALGRPDGLALTEAASERLFGEPRALGRQVRAQGSGGEATLTVQAILPAPPANALLQYEAMVGIDAVPARATEESRRNWWMSGGQVYARLAPGASAEQLGQLAQSLLDRQPPPTFLPADFLTGGGKPAYLRAMPLSRRGLDGAGSPARRLQIMSVGTAALATLALAAINFVNLGSVRTLKRQREIGLRKSMGAGRLHLLRLFLAESVLVALLAGAVGVGLAWLLMPVFAELLQHRFDTQVFTAGGLLATAFGCVLLGLLTGVPLAGIALRVNSAASLAGRSHSEGAAGRWLRQALTVLQFGAATALSALALVVLWQSQHAGHSGNGFQAEGRLAFDLPWRRPPGQDEALLQELRRLPGVSAVTSSADVPGRGEVSAFSSFESQRAGQRSEVTLRRGNLFTPGYFELYGVPLLAGRLSTDHQAEAGRALVLDRDAVQALGFASPQAAIGETVRLKGEPARAVAAVVENLRLENTRETHVPNVFEPVAEVQRAISLRSSDPAATLQAVNTLLRDRFPDDAELADTVAALQAQVYRDDQRLGFLVGLGGLAALLMAGVGIYALAAYTLKLKTREIVLRKLHGARPAAVAAVLLREFGTLIVAGAALGLPVAWIGGQNYLAQFVRQAPIGAWPLLIALGAVALVTLLAVCRHTMAALALRPAAALQS